MCGHHIAHDTAPADHWGVSGAPSARGSGCWNLEDAVRPGRRRAGPEPEAVGLSARSLQLVPCEAELTRRVGADVAEERNARGRRRTRARTDVVGCELFWHRGGECPAQCRGRPLSTGWQGGGGTNPDPGTGLRNLSPASEEGGTSARAGRGAPGSGTLRGRDSKPKVKPRRSPLGSPW